MNKSLRVLFVEDNLADANLAAEYIKQTGLDVEVNWIDNGEKAIEFFERVVKGKTERPDLVF